MSQIILKIPRTVNVHLLGLVNKKVKKGQFLKIRKKTKIEKIEEKQPNDIYVLTT